jgi:hypothetical protein
VKASPAAGGVALVTGLLTPEAYPHAVVVPIRVVETHISWVVLTGTYAYKIKKPVRLSFLDYSTLERRRACCDEELRLNRRYAPDLYLDVVPIGGTERAPRVEAAGNTLEYAVRMRQFDARDELGALLSARAVEPAEMAELGEHIARFHAVADIARTDSPYGVPESIHRITRDNFAELRQLPQAAARGDELRSLEAWVDTAHASLHGRMLGRREQGAVRECHGDLHCGNVVRWAGRLTPFDGIEFDPSLRFVDVTSDLAFLTMDLAVRGRDDLRHIVLQAWCETLGDFAGLPLLPYYEIYRSLVRAKVATLRALQEPAAAPARAADCASAAAYLDWARRRVERAPPVLVMTCGLSGSGKTWLAKSLAGALPALHVRSDVERKRLAGLGPLDESRSPPEGGIYTPEFNDRTYARLHDCAAAALAGRETLIVDAAFLRAGERRRLLELADRLGVPAVILHCSAPVAVLRERVRQRMESRLDASEAGLDVLERQPGYWEPFAADEVARVVTVDTSLPTSTGVALDGIRRLTPG